jgi:DNA-binding helix-hairpin-helix protein with protein kinase domain
MKRLLALALLLPLAGCISTASHIVMAPVHAASWTVDKMTTSQSEADRNRGRRDRKAEEKQRKEDKKEAKRQRELEKQQAHYSDPN